MSNISNSILKLQEHQEYAYKEVNKLFKEGRYASVIFPTGCGKSFVTLQYILEHPDEKILFLSPRNAIKEQMYEYIVRFIGGRTDSVEEIQAEFGSMENAAQSFIPGIKAMTYQSLLDINKKDSILKKTLENINPNLIVIDEMHHIKTKNNSSRNSIEEDEEELSDIEKTELEKEQNEWGKCFQKLLDICPNAKVLGLSATPIRTDGANVVERIFKNSVASELSLLEAMEEGIILPPKYVVPDFIKEEELKTLLEQIEEADEKRKPQLKQEYDDLVKKSEKAPGIPELMDEHITERNGKYIVFCKDLKDMEEKQTKAKEWFGKIDKEPTIYRVSSKHSDSQEQLDGFNKNESEHLKIMYCVGMIDEGVHLNNVSGVILAAKTGSRPAYLQRIGRAISSGDNKKQALVIDLVNNNEILFQDKCRENGEQITDTEALSEVIDWINEKNEGELPSYENAKADKEKAMAKRLRRINNKYYKYIENEDLLNNLSEDRRDEIEEILMLGENISLWEDYIEIEDEQEEMDNTYINEFLKNIEIKGTRKDLKGLLEEIQYRESSNSELLRVCEALVQKGFNFNNFKLGKRINKKDISTTLEDIAQENPNLNIEEVLDETGVDINYSIGKKISQLKRSIKGRGTAIPPTEEEKKAFEELAVINLQEILDGKESTNSELLRVCEALVQRGFDFNNFKQSKKMNKKDISTTLEDIAQENPNLNIEEVLGETEVDINYSIGKKIQILKRSIKGKGTCIPPTEEEKIAFEELGVINLQKILDGKESANSELLRVCEALVQRGFDFNNFKQSKKINKKDIFITLEDIAQENPNLNIEELLDETEVDINYSIGIKIQGLKRSIKGKGTGIPPTEEEKRAFEELGVINLQELLDGKESANSELLKVCKVLVQKGFDFNNFKKSKRINKKDISTTLEDIAQENPDLNIEEVLDEAGVDINYSIGKKISQLKSCIKGMGKSIPPTEEEKRMFEELGVVNIEELLNGKESNNSELLRVCEVLIKNGFSFSNFKESKKIKIGGKIRQIATTLEDIKQQSTDLNIEKVLNETEVDINYSIGGKIRRLKNSIKGIGTFTPTTEEEKRRFAELGVIDLEELEFLKKVTGQKVGEAGFGSDTKVCDEIQRVFNSELEKNIINQKTK